MFGMGMGELLLILVVALLFVGPDKLPNAAKAIGKGIRDFRRHTQDLQNTLEQDEKLGEAVRELRSALHGDPLRTRPLPPPRPAPPPIPADATGDAAATATAGAGSAGAGAAAASAADGDPAAPGDPDASPPAPPAAAPPAAADDGTPTITPAAGAVAKEPRGAAPAPRAASADDPHG